MNEEINVFERLNNWIRNSVMLKLAAICFLILLLLIPSEMVRTIIRDRENLNNETTSEVSSKWANEQLINGPVLTVPVLYEYGQGEKKTQSVKMLNILPEHLDITGKIETEKLKRGIYKVVVYKSVLSVSGSFFILPKPEQPDAGKILWDQAYMTLGIADLRGIEDEIVLNWNNENLNVQPGSKIPALIHSGVTFTLPAMEKSENQSVSFRFDMKLQGSRNISFIPAGNTTTVHLTSSWQSPSFNGNFLPDHREISAEGFTADWKILQINRNYPQFWYGSEQAENINQSSFGVDLILPVDDYQKSMRSAKYAVMTISLTFLIFFLVEILNGRRIHPFQYTLVGLSLCLFYILLISITEHSNFNLAYLISAVSVITMISLYSRSVFKDMKLTLLLMATLAGIYGFLYVTLQLADYALLLGSIGLTLILAITMYFTRNINWYRLQSETDSKPGANP